MSSRFPSEDYPAPRFPTDGAIGTIRAHDQAAIDKFLRFAEQERRRLEAKVIAAELRYREAHAELAEATLENQQVAEHLYVMWHELQAEREHTSRVVSARLDEVRAEAEELAGWTGPNQGHREVTYAVAYEPEEPQTWWGTDDEPVAPHEYTAAEAAFFDDDVDDGVSWSRLEDPAPPVREVRQDPVARRSPPPSAAPLSPPSSPPERSMPRPTESSNGSADHVDHAEFWQVEHAAAALRVNQLEDTFMAVLPMLAVVAILVAILAWIG